MNNHYKSIDDLYPLTIVCDRYNGTYSGGKYTAWIKHPDELPSEIDSDDISCMCFWSEYNRPVGRGSTPDAAANDLLKQLMEMEEYNVQR